MLSGMPDLAGAAGALLLADPFTFPTDAVLRELSAAAPMLPLLGGLASARSPDAETPLLLGDEVLTSGAVGVRFDGVEILPCVSQGAAPIGPELTITACEGPIIGELAGRPALEKLRETIEALDRRRPRARAGRAADGHRHRRRTSPTTSRATSSCAGSSAPIRTPARSRSAPTCGPARSCGCTRATPPAPTATCARRWARGCSALGGRRARRGAADLLQRARRRACSATPTTTPPRSTTRSAARRPPASSPRARSGPVGGEYFLHGFTATVAVFAHEPRRAQRPADRRERRHRRRPPRARWPRAARRVIVTRAAGRASSRRSPREIGGRAIAADLAEPDGPERLVAAAGDVDVLVANAGAVAGRRDHLALAGRGRPRARVNLRAPVDARAAARRADGGARLGPPRVRLVAVRASRPARSRRSTRRRSSACAGSRSSLRLDLADHGVGVSCVSPGFVGDAGMFADSGAPLPPGVRHDHGRRRSPRRSSARSSATARRSTRRRSSCAPARGSPGVAPGAGRGRQQARRLLDRPRGRAGPRRPG